RHRDHHFLKLPLHRSLGGEEEVFDQLLRDRRSALLHLSFTDVPEQRPPEPSDIDARMHDELTIFNCYHHIHIIPGRIRVRNDRLFLAGLVIGDRRNHLRFEQTDIEIAFRIDVSDPGDAFASVAESYQEIGELPAAVDDGVVRGMNFNGIALDDAVPPTLGIGVLGGFDVAEAVEVGFDRLKSRAGALAQRPRRRIDARGTDDHVAAQTRVDQFGVLHVEDDEYRNADEGQDGYGNEELEGKYTPPQRWTFFLNLPGDLG